MVPVSAFFSRLLPQAIGCPEPLAQQAVVDAAIAFCERSLVVTTLLEPVSVQAGVSDYELYLPSQMVLAQVLQARFEGEQLQSEAEAQATVARTSGTPRYFSSTRIDEGFVLTLVPTPDRNSTDGLLVKAATKPKRNATQLASILFDDWADAVVDGALAILYGTPDQPYSDETKGVLLATRARSKANMARLDGLHGRVQSSMSVSMRRF